MIFQKKNLFIKKEPKIGFLVLLIINMFASEASEANIFIINTDIKFINFLKNIF